MGEYQTKKKCKRWPKVDSFLKLTNFSSWLISHVHLSEWSHTSWHHKTQFLDVLRSFCWRVVQTRQHVTFLGGCCSESRTEEVQRKAETSDRKVSGFKSLLQLSSCQSVLGQDTGLSIAADEPGRGRLLVCDYVHEWEVLSSALGPMKVIKKWLSSIVVWPFTNNNSITSILNNHFCHIYQTQCEFCLVKPESLQSEWNRSAYRRNNRWSPQPYGWCNWNSSCIHYELQFPIKIKHGKGWKKLCDTVDYIGRLSDRKCLS